MEVHQRLDASDLWVLDRPDPTTIVKALYAFVESLRVYLNTILDARVPESKAPSTEPVEDTVLAAFFSTATMQPPPQ